MYNLQSRLWHEKRKVLAKELAAILLRLDALRIGNFTLTSGKTSPYYIDLRILPSYPTILEKIADMYIEVIRNEIREEKIKIAGVPTAGLPIATAISLKARLPLIYVRETPKLHGRKKLIEGVLEEGEGVVLVDDLITTGKSLVKAAESIRASGGRVSHAVVLIDREEGGRENLEKIGVKLHSVATISELLSWLEEISALPAENLRIIRGYLARQKETGQAMKEAV